MTAKPLLICLSVLLAGRAFAQHAAALSGSVFSEQGKPVPKAVLEAMNADRLLLGSASSDAEGKFRLDLSSLQDAALTVSAPGFQPKRIVLTAADTSLRIVLVATALADVVVSAKAKPLVERKPDRIVFHVASSLTATGGTAYDAVKKTPSVIVSERDNRISIAGRSAAQVLVNGRLLQLSGEDLTAYLQSLPSDQVERIEVITAPPAGYDAAGNAGLINIVLKKNRATGIRGTARAGYEQSTYGTGIAGGTINAGKGAFVVYASGNATGGAKHNMERLSSELPGQAYRLVEPYKKQVDNVQYTAGIDYRPAKNQVFGVQLSRTAADRTDKGTTTVTIDNLRTGATDSTALTRNDNTTLRRTTILNLNYVWDIDSAGRKLTVNLNRLDYTGRRDRNFSTVGYYGAQGGPTGFAEQARNSGAQDVAVRTAQLDLALPYRFATLSAGAKLSSVDNYSSNDYSLLENGMWVNNPNISNAFRYRESVQAAYAGAEKELGKWSAQAGLRMEATRTEGYSPTLQKTNASSYLNLFPNLTAGYKPSESHVFGISYTRRINRPGYSELNPFRVYSSPYLYYEGNPYLRPSYNHTMELSYTLRQQFSFSAYGQYEAAHFGLLFGVDTALGAAYTATANFGAYSAYGVSVSATLKPAAWWEVQAFAAGGVQQVRIDAAVTGRAGLYGRPSVYLSANNSFALNKSRTLLAEVNAYYISPQQEDLFNLRASGSLDTAFRATTRDKRWSASLGITDLLATQRARAVNQLTGQSLDSYFDQRNLRLMLNYKFGSDKAKAPRERATGIEEEGKRT